MLSVLLLEHFHDENIMFANDSLPLWIRLKKLSRSIPYYLWCDPVCMYSIFKTQKEYSTKIGGEILRNYTICEWISRITTIRTYIHTTYILIYNIFCVLLLEITIRYDTSTLQKREREREKQNNCTGTYRYSAILIFSLSRFIFSLSRFTWLVAVSRTGAELEHTRVLLQYFFGPVNKIASFG